MLILSTRWLVWSKFDNKLAFCPLHIDIANCGQLQPSQVSSCFVFEYSSMEFKDSLWYACIGMGNNQNPETAS